MSNGGLGVVGFAARRQVFGGGALRNRGWPTTTIYNITQPPPRPRPPPPPATTTAHMLTQARSLALFITLGLYADKAGMAYGIPVPAVSRFAAPSVCELSILLPLEAACGSAVSSTGSGTCSSDCTLAATFLRDTGVSGCHIVATSGWYAISSITGAITAGCTRHPNGVWSARPTAVGGGNAVEAFGGICEAPTGEAFHRLASTCSTASECAAQCEAITGCTRGHHETLNGASRCRCFGEHSNLHGHQSLDATPGPSASSLGFVACMRRAS